ncbi:hypothetical protein [Sphingopyxis sp. PET50]|uniref:hypothetical protein n=1 Tax=Sphingopyxis sp. PET50 TaxID=2976533 RepID=UPI0021AEC033|nr:hypothetical protein [Sphingopyxis sp. PET50]
MWRGARSTPIATIAEPIPTAASSSWFRAPGRQHRLTDAGKSFKQPATGGEEEIYDVRIEDVRGRIIGSVPAINDSMPFVLRWSPRRDWFLINHWLGSGLEQPRVFQITPSGVIEHRDHLRAGLAQAHRISPCLPVDKLEASGSGLKWSRDGRRLAWVYVTRPDMCVFYGDMSGPIPADKQWKPFLMISDVDTGGVVAGSIRLLPGDGKWDFPTDGPYADF